MILDIHTLLWVDCNDPKLAAMARLQIEADWRAGLLVVSAISFWEATMLAERDRISLPTSPERWRANWLRAGLVEIPINGWIALQSYQLTNFHLDPADRFIVVTALDRDLPLMTADKNILEWEGTLNRLDASELICLCNRSLRALNLSRIGSERHRERSAAIHYSDFIDHAPREWTATSALSLLAGTKTSTQPSLRETT